MAIRDKLIRLCPPPARPAERPRAADLAEAARALGTPLPDDYRWFVETYGTGKIGDILWIYSPATAHDFLHVVAMQDEAREALAELLESDAPEELEGAAAEDFVCFGSDDAGDLLLWRRADLGKKKVPPALVVSRLGSAVTEVSGGMLELVRAALEDGAEGVPALGVELDERTFVPVEEDET